MSRRDAAITPPRPQPLLGPPNAPGTRVCAGPASPEPQPAPADASTNRPIRPPAIEPSAGVRCNVPSAVPEPDASNRLDFALHRVAGRVLGPDELRECRANLLGAATILEEWAAQSAQPEGSAAP